MTIIILVPLAILRADMSIDGIKGSALTVKTTWNQTDDYFFMIDTSASAGSKTGIITPANFFQGNESGIFTLKNSAEGQNLNFTGTQTGGTPVIVAGVQPDFGAAGSLYVNGFLRLISSELTISGGIVTTRYSRHTVDTEGDAATDDLDTINGGVAGVKVLLRAAHTDRTVVVKHGTGNIRLAGGVDFSLDSTYKLIELFTSDGTTWLECYRAANS